MALISPIKNGDWESVRKAIAQLASQKLGVDSTPVFGSITVDEVLTTDLNISSLTASRLLASDASKDLVSTDLNSWVTGTANQITVTDDADGTITLSTPQDIHTGASPLFTGMEINSGGAWSTMELDGTTGSGFNFKISNVSSWDVFQSGDSFYFDSYGVTGLSDVETNVFRIYKATGNLTSRGNLQLNYVSDGTGNVGNLKIYDQDAAEYLNFDVSNGIGYLQTEGSSPGALSLQYNAHANIVLFDGAASGETPLFCLSGFRTGDVKRQLCIGISSSADNTLSITGLGTYNFDGIIKDGSAGTSTQWNTAYTHSQIAGGDSVHVSTTENTNWDTAYTHSQLTSGNPHSVTKSDVGLGSVENTALSTWAGSSNITTVGTLTGPLNILENSDTITLTHDGADAYIKTLDGSLIFQTDEGTNTNTIVEVRGKGTGTSHIRLRNMANEDSDNGRESRLYFDGYQSGGELHSLGFIQGCHTGTSDNQLGKIGFYINDTNDGTEPSRNIFNVYRWGVQAYCLGFADYDRALDLVVTGGVKSFISAIKITQSCGAKASGTTSLLDFDFTDGSASSGHEIRGLDMAMGAAAGSGTIYGLYVTDADWNYFEGYVKLASVKSGATQAGAGAVANEVWKTSGHATLPDNVLMIGV